jgi:hypothetical protein
MMKGESHTSVMIRVEKHEAALKLQLAPTIAQQWGCSNTRQSSPSSSRYYYYRAIIKRRTIDLPRTALFFINIMMAAAATPIILGTPPVKHQLGSSESGGGIVNEYVVSCMRRSDS